MSCASLVAISTLFTKQHHVADVLAGMLLAVVACAVLLRSYSRADIPEFHRRLARALALCVSGIVGLVFACFWVAYKLAPRCNVLEA